jgi:hypothetical protein
MISMYIRNLAIPAIILILSTLFGSILNGQENSHDSYLVKKIKSKKSWYVIYAMRNDSLYKIVSDKVKHQDRKCNQIVVGEKYDLILKSNIPEVNGIKLMPINYLDVKTIFSPGQSVWSIEPRKGIFDTFHTDNLKGRCYTK